MFFRMDNLITTSSSLALAFQPLVRVKSIYCVQTSELTVTWSMGDRPCLEFFILLLSGLFYWRSYWASPYGSGYPLPIRRAIQPGSLSRWCLRSIAQPPPTKLS